MIYSILLYFLPVSNASLHKCNMTEQTQIDRAAAGIWLIWTHIYIHISIYFYSCWIYTCCLLLSVSTSLLSMLLFARHVSQACLFSVIVNFQLHKELFMHKYVRFCASPRETSLLPIEKNNTDTSYCYHLCNALQYLTKYECTDTCYDVAKFRFDFGRIC